MMALAFTFVQKGHDTHVIYISVPSVFEEAEPNIFRTVVAILNHTWDNSYLIIAVLMHSFSLNVIVKYH